MKTLEQLRAEFEHALLSMDQVGAKVALFTAVTHANLPVQPIEQIVVPVMERLGAEWQAGRLALSQIYMAGRICEELVDQILPAASPMRKRQPPMAIAALEDYHLLGKRIVYSLLRASGFELKDYGRVDVPTLVRQVREDRIALLLISVLMLPSALRIKEVKAGLAGIEWPFRLVVGGAPFRLDDQLWKEVGADATSPDASGVVAIIDRFSPELLNHPQP